MTIGDRIGARSRFRSLDASATGDPRNSLSGRGGGNLNPSEVSAAAMYQRIFGTGFKDQVTANAGLQAGPFSLAYTFRYFSSVVTSTNGDRIPAYTYHDLQAKMTVGEEKNFELYVGVNNLFDKQPPIVSDLANQWPGTNTVASTYDLIGRRFYAGARAKF